MLFFILRLIFGYFQYPVNYPVLREYNFGSVDFQVKNFASSRLEMKGKLANQTVNMEQKYEQIGDLNAGTANFDEDERRLRETIKKYNALIQYERNTGLKGSRQLYMAIGVQPDTFDTMVSDLKQIGRLRSFEVYKNDKTNDYKELMVKKTSLEKTRQALLDLKGKGGKIDEFVRLEDRILALEEQIQDLGVELGEFDAENEFCTIKYAMAETKAAGKIPFWQRIKVALEWTIKYYCLFVFTIFLVGLASLILATLLDKLKVFANLTREPLER